MASSLPENFISVSGDHFMLGDQALTLRGANLGNWMLVEHYMIGLPWTEYEMRRTIKARLGEEAFHAFWDTFEECSFAEADAAWFASEGFNFLQLPFNYRFFGHDRTCEAFPDGFPLLDRAVEICRRHGIFLMPGMHAMPGAQLRDWNAESAFGEAMYWEHDFHIEESIRIWKEIAARYVDEPIILGYELINEPLTEPEILNNVYRRLTKGIREVDPHHIIVYSGNAWNKRLEDVVPNLLEDPQTALTQHMYVTAEKPWKNLKSFPGEWQGQTLGPAEMTAHFERLVNARTAQRPVIIGEFGLPKFISRTINDRSGLFPAHKAMVSHIVDLFNQLGHAWNFWALKDIGTLGLLNPAPDTPWMRFIQSEEVHRLRYDFPGRISKVVKEFTETTPEMDDEDAHLLRHQLGHAWHQLALPYIVDRMKTLSLEELREMARSFAFENCTPDADRLEVYRRGIETEA